MHIYNQTHAICIWLASLRETYFVLHTSNNNDAFLDSRTFLYSFIGVSLPLDLFVAKIVNKMQRKEIRNVGRAKYTLLT